MSNKRTGRTATTQTVKRVSDIPAGEPSRYLSAHGYVRLRWLVAPLTYAECYEHRMSAGFPPSHLHVHHIDGDKTNNAPSNLRVMTAAAHQSLHGTDEDWMRRALRNRKKRQPLDEYPRCTLNGCERPAQCIDRTLCLKHYKAEKRRNDRHEQPT